MSGLQKRMRRKLLLTAAREQRKATAGAGQYRRPVASWVQSTKADLMDVFRPAQTPVETVVPSEVTAR